MTVNSARYSLWLLSSRSQMGAACDGIRRLAEKYMTAIPRMATGTPRAASSNMEMAPYPDASLKSLTMMLVDVPIRVQVPASMDA